MKSCRAARSAQRAASPRYDETVTTYRSPASRARAITASRSASNGSIVRCAWLSLWAVIAPRLLHPPAGRDRLLGCQDERLAGGVGGGEEHPLRDHAPERRRLQVGHHDDGLADQALGRVARRDAADDRARRAAAIACPRQ